MNFKHVRLYVRVSGLPLGYLSSAWAMQALHHDGFIEEMEDKVSDLPCEPQFRARMLLDLSRLLISSWLLPLYDSQVIWVYFRY